MMGVSGAVWRAGRRGAWRNKAHATLIACEIEGKRAEAAGELDAAGTLVVGMTCPC